MVVTVFRPRLHYKGARAQKLHRKQKFRQNSEFFPAPARFFAARLTAPARCRTSRTAHCCGTARSTGCSRSRSTRTKSEQKTAKASPRGDAFAAVLDALRDAGDLIVLGLDRALEHGVVHRGAERHDGGARRVADGLPAAPRAPFSRSPRSERTSCLRFEWSFSLQFPP